MREELIFFIIMWGIAVFYIIWGIRTGNKKEPAGFWTGEKISPESLTDIRAYNRACKRMWQLCSIPFWVCGPIVFLWPQAVIFIFAVCCVAGIGWLVWYYNRIRETYSK